MRHEYAAAHERHSVGARYRSEAEGTAKTRDKEKGVACAPNSLFWIALGRCPKRWRREYNANRILRFFQKGAVRYCDDLDFVLLYYSKDATCLQIRNLSPSLVAKASNRY